MKMDINEHRGVSTRDGMTSSINDEIPGRRGMGAMDKLQLSLDELDGRTLDIGIGGGKVVEEAVALGYDYVGVDIIPALDVGDDPQGGYAIRKRELENLARTYPGRIFAVDGAVSLPFPDDSFNTVLSAIALPGYSRSPEEALQSILEMIRVSRGFVIFNAEIDNPENGTMSMGLSAVNFDFKMQQLLNELGQLGVTYEFRVFKDAMLPSLHLNVSHKDKLRFEAFAKIADPQEYLLQP